VRVDSQGHPYPIVVPKILEGWPLLHIVDWTGDDADFSVDEDNQVTMTGSLACHSMNIDVDGRVHSLLLGEGLLYETTGHLVATEFALYGLIMQSPPEFRHVLFGFFPTLIPSEFGGGHPHCEHLEEYFYPRFAKIVESINPGTDAAGHWSRFWTDRGMQLYFYSAEQEKPSLRIGEV
jgi:hypothetical protein